MGVVALIKGHGQKVNAAMLWNNRSVLIARTTVSVVSQLAATQVKKSF